MDETDQKELRPNILASPASETPRATATTTTASSSHRIRKRFWSQSWWIILHLMTIAIYAVPLFVIPNHGIMSGRTEEAVLDEIHITSSDNKDVNGPSTLRTIFTNDYWGRPLSWHASHKSWRPLTILSFRYLRGIGSFSDLAMHRLVNVLTHAAASELVGILATRLFAIDSCERDTMIRFVAKLCFALHPTHVEVVANAANRSHILSVLLTVYASDPTVAFIWFALAIVLALVSSETALFQVVSTAVTCAAIAYRRDGHHLPSKQGNRHWFFQVWSTVFRPAVFVRLAFLGTAAIVYYGGRLYFDTLSIPVDLIRSAENPFFPLVGWTRVYSYALVLAIHIGKQWDADWVGFSHEYGHACVEPVYDWADPRMSLPVGGIAVAHVMTWLIFLVRPTSQRNLSLGFLIYCIYMAWTVTLFPVSGIVKVGTFISDRIVVPSSVPVALIQAYAIVAWLNPGGPSPNSSGLVRPWVKRAALLIVALLATKRIYTRSREWMSSHALLESSLRTCPRFGKAHSEISKIYSGLDMSQYNLTRSKWHLQQAEAFDPDYCDVHQQFAMIAAKEHNYMELETRLTEALQCRFTNTGAFPMWQQYWEIQLNAQQQPPALLEANQKRYNDYVQIVNKAVEVERLKEEAKKSSELHQRKSPFAFLWHKAADDV